MTDFTELFRQLAKHVQELEVKFVSPHLSLPPGTPSSSYDLDVRAYCVFSHSAFEQYIEDVCNGLANDAYSMWIANRSCSHTLLALMAFHSSRQKIEEDETKPATSFFDYIRLATERAQSEFMSYLKERNNGVSEKYLRRMLAPVGLNIPNDPRWLGSLSQLASQRGDNAHRSQAKRIPLPQDAKTWVEDCMEMWAAVTDEAKQALHRPQFIEDFRHPII